jgi:hypothetical protein
MRPALHFGPSDADPIEQQTQAMLRVGLDGPRMLIAA